MPPDPAPAPAPAPVVVHIPQALRVLVPESPATVPVLAGSLEDVFRQLDGACPGLARRVLDDAGRVRRFVHVFVDHAPVAQDADPARVRVAPGARVHVLPSVAGGACA